MLESSDDEKTDEDELTHRKKKPAPIAIPEVTTSTQNPIKSVKVDHLSSHVEVSTSTAQDQLSLMQKVMPADVRGYFSSLNPQDNRNLLVQDSFMFFNSLVRHLGHSFYGESAIRQEQSKLAEEQGKVARLDAQVKKYSADLEASKSSVVVLEKDKEDLGKQLLEKDDLIVKLQERIVELKKDSENHRARGDIAVAEFVKLQQGLPDFAQKIMNCDAVTDKMGAFFAATKVYERNDFFAKICKSLNLQPPFPEEIVSEIDEDCKRKLQIAADETDVIVIPSLVELSKREGLSAEDILKENF